MQGEAGYSGSEKVTLKPRAKTRKPQRHENVADIRKDGLSAEERKNLKSWRKEKKGSSLECSTGTLTFIHSINIW